MEITVVKEFTFEAAHYLPNYDGPCKNLHGHTYKLQIGVKGEPNDQTGMVIDFSRLKHLVDTLIIHATDHKLLNEVHHHILGFPNDNPTAENLLMWIVRALEQEYPVSLYALAFARLYETPTNYVEWRRSEDNN